MIILLISITFTLWSCAQCCFNTKHNPYRRGIGKRDKYHRDDKIVHKHDKIETEKDETNKVKKNNDYKRKKLNKDFRTKLIRTKHDNK